MQTEPQWFHEARDTHARRWDALQSPIQTASEAEREARAGMVSDLIAAGHLVTANRDWTPADKAQMDALLMRLAAANDEAGEHLTRRENLQ